MICPSWRVGHWRCRLRGDRGTMIPMIMLCFLLAGTFGCASIAASAAFLAQRDLAGACDGAAIAAANAVSRADLGAVDTADLDTPGLGGTPIRLRSPVRLRSPAGVAVADRGPVRTVARLAAGHVAPWATGSVVQPAAGSAGTAGSAGSSGSAGPAGSLGSAGPAGSVGSGGPAGPAGPVGSVGSSAAAGWPAVGAVARPAIQRLEPFAGTVGAGPSVGRAVGSAGTLEGSARTGGPFVASRGRSGAWLGGPAARPADPGAPPVGTGGRFTRAGAGPAGPGSEATGRPRWPAEGRAWFASGVGRFAVASLGRGLNGADRSGLDGGRRPYAAVGSGPGDHANGQRAAGKPYYASDSGAGGGPGLPLDPAAVERAVAAYQASVGVGGSPIRMTAITDGQAVTVTCQRTVRIPFGRLLGYSDGLDRTAIAHARSPLD